MVRKTSHKRFLGLFFISAFSITIASCSNNENYVNFYNFDGSLLWQTKYYPGMQLSYGGETPIKQPDEVYEYTFSGWNHSLRDVDKHRNYYALYNKDFRSFTVSFENYDNTLLKTATVKYGQSAFDFAPEDPVRTNEARTHYKFSHWEGNDLSYVTSDLVCTAVYSEIECFEIKYIDYDNTLIKTEYVEKGKDALFEYSNFRDADPDHYYAFSGWDTVLTNVQCDMVAKATYKLVNAYTVTFKNYNGTILGTSKGPEGFTAQYNGSTPTRPSTTSGDYQYTYTFSGWDKKLENVQQSFETTAQFNTTSYNYRYPEIVSEIKDYVRKHGGYSDGTYGYVFSIDTSGGYVYTGILELSGSSLSIWMTTIKNDSTGSRSTSTRLYLSSNWNNGNFYFTYQFLVKNNSGSTIQEDLGDGDLYGPSFSGSSTIYFDWYSGTMNKSVAAANCASMISISLDKFAKSSTWSMSSLGFNNYNY